MPFRIRVLNGYDRLEVRDIVVRQPMLPRTGDNQCMIPGIGSSAVVDICRLVGYGWSLGAVDNDGNFNALIALASTLSPIQSAELRSIDLVKNAMN